MQKYVNMSPVCLINITQTNMKVVLDLLKLVSLGDNPPVSFGPTLIRGVGKHIKRSPLPRVIIMFAGLTDQRGAAETLIRTETNRVESIKMEK